MFNFTFTQEQVVDFIKAFILLAAGMPLLKLASKKVEASFAKRVSGQIAMLSGKILFYSGLAILIACVLRLLEFELAPLLGAAGVIGVAVGFASQTSFSNIISGLFLISEKPFEIGDVINVDGNTGIVKSIDLLSVKIQTFDNRLVRLPNENLLKSTLTNVTRFPIRRMDLKVGVAYKEDPERVKSVLTDIARGNPYCLDEPEPLIIFTDFGDSALEFLVGLWFVKTDYLKLRGTIMSQIKLRFDKEDIEIPFPHRTLYAGSETAPFPVTVVESAGQNSTQ